VKSLPEMTEELCYFIEFADKGAMGKAYVFVSTLDDSDSEESDGDADEDDHFEVDLNVPDTECKLKAVSKTQSVSPGLSVRFRL